MRRLLAPFILGQFFIHFIWRFYLLFACILTSKSHQKCSKNAPQNASEFWIRVLMENWSIPGSLEPWKYVFHKMQKSRNRCLGKATLKSFKTTIKIFKNPSKIQSKMHSEMDATKSLKNQRIFYRFGLSKWRPNPSKIVPKSILEPSCSQDASKEAPQKLQEPSQTPFRKHFGSIC